MSSTTSDPVINKLKDIFARWGIPEELVSDNGPQFSLELFFKFSQDCDFKHTTSSPYHPQANGEAESAVRIAKKTLKQSDPFVALMSYRATPHTATGVNPSQLLMGREIRTLLPTLESNLKPISVPYEAVAERDEKSKTAYPQSFDKRHGLQALSELQPGDGVHLKLDQQKGWKTPGVVIAKCSTPKSYVIETPQSIVRRNRRHLRPATSPIEVEKFAKLEPDLDPEQELSLKFSTADVSELHPTVTQYKVPLVTQAHHDVMSSHQTFVKSSGAESRTSSGRVVRKPIRFREDT